MGENIFYKIAASKDKFHKRQAKLSFEEKVKAIVELQKLDMEIRGKKYKGKESYKRVWIFNNSK